MVPPVTVPTAVLPPSRNTEYVSDVAMLSVEAGHVTTARPELGLATLGLAGIDGAVVSATCPAMMRSSDLGLSGLVLVPSEARMR